MNARSRTSLFLHADGDSFFVECELSKRPELRGKPVIVGGDKGIAVAMSREAKKLGVHRGMPVFKIKKLYPEVIILEHTFSLYREISNKMYEIMISYMEEVEEYSIDECFAIVRHSDLVYFGGPQKLLEEIRNDIWRTLGVSYSFGIARTKALAKVASKLEKPGGVVALLSEEDEHDALRRTSIEDVWGIGFRTRTRFKNMGLQSAYDFIQLADDEIERHFSSTHLSLKHELAGHSLYAVHADTDPRDQKSIQSTETFRPASSDRNVIWAEIAKNVEGACENARDLQLLSNTVSFFVKTSEFTYRFDQVKLTLFSADPGFMLNELEEKFLELLVPGEKIRSTGAILHNLRRVDDVPRDLFGVQQASIKRLAVEEAADKIREKYGHSSIRRAASLKTERHNRDTSFH